MVTFETARTIKTDCSGHLLEEQEVDVGGFVDRQQDKERDKNCQKEKSWLIQKCGLNGARWVHCFVQFSIHIFELNWQAEA